MVYAKIKLTYQKYENIILTLIYSMGIFLFIWGNFTFFYGMNDDILIENILSGSFTGNPEAHVINMLYPVSAFLSLLYRLFPSISWFGLFLLLCQFGSLAIIAGRSLLFFNHSHTKILILLMQAIIVRCTIFEYLVLITYTFTGGMVAMAAIFHLITVENNGNTSMYKFFIARFPTVLLAFLSFNIRPEIGLIILPFYFFVCLYKIFSTDIQERKQKVISYSLIFGSILFVYTIGQLIHLAAYNSPEWKEHLSFHKNRAALIDYHEIPDYDEHQEFYDIISVSKMELNMVWRWYYGFAENVNADLMGEIAAYAATLQKDELSLKDNLLESSKVYYYLFLHNYFIMIDRLLANSQTNEIPFNVIVLASYAFLFGFSIIQKKYWRIPILLLSLGILRSGIWMYIIMNGRVLTRVTLSLYCVEAAILFGMVLNEIKAYKKTLQPLCGVIGLIITVVAITNMPLFANDLNYWNKDSEAHQVFHEYCQRYPDNFYIVPTSSYPWDFRIFGVIKQESNYGPMGLWTAKSPLMEKKLETFMRKNINPPNIGMADALVECDTVFMIIKNGYDYSYLYQFYQERNRDVIIHLVDDVSENLKVYEFHLSP